MKRRQAILAALLVLSAGAAFFSLKEEAKTAPPVVAADTGFAGAIWGGSPADVESFYGKPLTALADSVQFYSQAKERPDRYRSYEQKDVRILGRPSRAVYTFFDERLFTVHLFLTDTDAVKLDGDVRRYLIRHYGDYFSEVPDEETPLQVIGHFKDRIVNYWLLEQGVSLRPRYTAVIGITRRFITLPTGGRVDF